jgi:molecular chaperone HtpG
MKAIAQRLEKKIKSEFETMLGKDREKYEKFWEAFGLQIKFGLYDNYGAAKETLKDLVLYYSSSEKKLVTFGEYTARMQEDQKYIYYATGESIDKIDKMPQTELLKDKGYEILYGSDPVDEFALKMMREYDGKEFRSVSEGDLGLEESEEDKKKADKKAEKYADLLGEIKKALGDKVTDVRLSKRLKSHPVVLVSEGGLSLEMEKILKQMPGAEAENIKAERILEINADHSVLKALGKLFESDKKQIKEYAGILYDQALLMEGLPIEDPVAFSNAICKLIEKTA